MFFHSSIQSQESLRQTIQCYEKSSNSNHVRQRSQKRSQLSSILASEKKVFYEQSTRTIFLVMDYAEGGDIATKIRKAIQKGDNIPEQQIWRAIVHIAQGLHSLHSKKIIHKYLKSVNIFITSNQIYKLGDLNVSKVLKNDFAKHKSALLCTFHHKYGKINLTIKKLIFGHQDVSYIKWQLKQLLLQQVMFKDFIEKYQQEIQKKFLTNTQRHYGNQLKQCSTKILKKDHHLHNQFQCLKQQFITNNHFKQITKLQIALFKPLKYTHIIQSHQRIYFQIHNIKSNPFQKNKLILINNYIPQSLGLIKNSLNKSSEKTSIDMEVLKENHKLNKINKNLQIMSKRLNMHLSQNHNVFLVYYKVSLN